MSHLKERELTLTSETKTIREELSKKSSLFIKMKEDKMRGASHATSSDPNATPSREKEELRNTIRHLEEKLRAANRAEKPLEESSGLAESEKALKTTEELAR